jgi:hypothetical protein
VHQHLDPLEHGINFPGLLQAQGSQPVGEAAQQEHTEGEKAREEGAGEAREHQGHGGDHHHLDIDQKQRLEHLFGHRHTGEEHQRQHRGGGQASAHAIPGP